MGFPPTPDATGDIDSTSFLAGQGVGLVKEIKPAAEVVRELIQGARELFSRLAANRGVSARAQPGDYQLIEHVLVIIMGSQLMPVLTISARALGKRTPLVPDWGLPWPPEEGSGQSLTLRDLITCIVHNEVRGFEKRQEKHKLVRILTEREIESGLEKGRVDSGGYDRRQEVDPDEAVGTALQAFEDGLYLVFLDEEEQRDLDKQVFLRPDSKLTFIRLSMLAGA
jgi:hypothetical protein